jgi:hypothetical protein
MGSAWALHYLLTQNTHCLLGSPMRTQRPGSWQHTVWLEGCQDECPMCHMPWLAMPQSSLAASHRRVCLLWCVQECNCVDGA